MTLDFGPAFSQAPTTLTAKVWNQKRYIGTHTLTISSTCWWMMNGAISGLSISTATSNQW
jgi:hypothetical protein